MRKTLEIILLCAMTSGCAGNQLYVPRMAADSLGNNDGKVSKSEIKQFKMKEKQDLPSIYYIVDKDNFKIFKEYGAQIGDLVACYTKGQTEQGFPIKKMIKFSEGQYEFLGRTPLTFGPGIVVFDNTPKPRPTLQSDPYREDRLRQMYEPEPQSIRWETKPPGRRNPGF